MPAAGGIIKTLRMFILRKHPVVTALIALLVAGAIAGLDLNLPYGVPLSFLYLLPMGMIGMVGSRSQILVAAALCTGIAEFSDAFVWTSSAGIPRDVLSFIAFAAEGLYIHEALAKRHVEGLHIAALQAENQARREIEEQLSLLVASSAIAIVTLDGNGVIVQANHEAGRMLLDTDSASSALLGTAVSAFLPALARVPHRLNPERPLRTMMQTQGFRKDGVPFLADVWFSTYTTTNGDRTAAMIVDASDDLRDREESGLEQLLSISRLAVGAVAHEIRNVSSAIQLVQRNLLTTTPSLGVAPDFLALQQLTSTLERMASVEIAQAKRTAIALPLQRCFEELHIVSQVMLREHNIALEWNVPENLPNVWADQPGLMQVFLNVFRNAQSALESTVDPRVRVDVAHGEKNIHIRISDNGPGVPTPNELFRPYWADPTTTSFGLYLSRAILHSFQGEIFYESANPGAAFVIALQVASL
jgi:two-component system sensor kinase FixL